MIRRQRHPHAHVLLAAMAELASCVADGLDYATFCEYVQRSLPDCAGVESCVVASTLDPAPEEPHLRMPLGGLHGDAALQLHMRAGRDVDIDIRAFAHAVGALAARVCSAPHGSLPGGVLDPDVVEAFLAETRRYFASGN